MVGFFRRSAEDFFGPKNRIIILRKVKEKFYVPQLPLPPVVPPHHDQAIM